MINLFWPFALADEWKSDRRASGDEFNLFLESQFDDFLIEAELDQFIECRFNTVHTAEISAYPDNFDVGELEDLLVKIEDLFTDYSFTQLSQFDHNDGLVNFTLFFCFFIQGIYRFDTAVE